MTAEYDGRVIATAPYSSHEATEGQGLWIVSVLPRRMFSRNQAITAMVLAERLAAGFGDDDLFVTALAVFVAWVASGRTLSGWADYIHLID